MSQNFHTFQEAREIFEAYLNRSLVIEKGLEEVLYRAMAYSLSAGGKRIRPVLLLLANAMFEQNTAQCLPFALAVEMIHTYSLIHDDLPCMDDDDLRRGRPTCHKAFSEDTAVLAGDALLNGAFETMLSATQALGALSNRGVRAMAILAESSGATGMIGGQILDMKFETEPPPKELLLRMYAKKTGALLKAPLQMGAVLGGATEDALACLERFGLSLGIAFQIQDDILDETSTPEQLGKPTKSDEKNHKTTYVSLCGLEESRRAVQEYTAQALDALSPFGEKAEPLRALAQSLLHRDH